ncbi:hypothetical protein ANN_03562 [Periplaneta americana]|uniref:Uncharacterized protein n=1 Tax=Periplaneta americana TaxID=6978 RepID=A0ABQ8U140_PERAM|nr:hypothetical protein ANN_03562 [Periplaneta americana]
MHRAETPSDDIQEDECTNHNPLPSTTSPTSPRSTSRKGKRKKNIELEERAAINRCMSVFESGTGKQTDEFHIFGEYVANELRVMKNDYFRYKMKNAIQQAIVNREMFSDYTIDKSLSCTAFLYRSLALISTPELSPLLLLLPIFRVAELSGLNNRSVYQNALYERYGLKIIQKYVYPMSTHFGFRMLRIDGTTGPFSSCTLLRRVTLYMMCICEELCRVLGYPPYLEAVSSIRYLRTRHAVVIGTHNTWNNNISNNK